MALKSFKRSSLQNMEHFQFADRVLKLCKQAAVEKLTEVLPPLEAAIAKEDEALNRTRSLDGTDALEKLDRRRDNAYHALRLLVEMEMRNDDEAVVEAAKTVAEVMSRYPNTTAVNYDKETGFIRNMVDDLRKEASAAAAVTKLKATAAVTRLETANTAFDDRYHQRVVAKTPKGTFDIKALRAAVDKALDAVVSRIEALDNLAPEEKISNLISHYNSLVDLRQDVVARRKGTGKSASGEKKKPGSGSGKKKETEEEKLARLLPEFEKANDYAAGSLSITGKSFEHEGSKIYQISINKSETDTIWVQVKRNKLVQVGYVEV